MVRTTSAETAEGQPREREKRWQRSRPHYPVCSARQRGGERAVVWESAGRDRRMAEEGERADGGGGGEVGRGSQARVGDDGGVIGCPGRRE